MKQQKFLTSILQTCEYEYDDHSYIDTIEYFDLQKNHEIATAKKVLDFIESVEGKVFSLNYVADDYIDAMDDVMSGLTVVKTQYESLHT